MSEIASRGEDILTAPIDKGFHRLAWLFPYFMGFAGAVAGAFAVVRWSRHSATTTKAPGGSDSIDESGLQARLDEELDNLD